MSVYDLGKRRRRGAVRPSPLFLAFVAATALGGVLAWIEQDVRGLVDGAALGGAARLNGGVGSMPTPAAGRGRREGQARTQ